MVRIRCTDHVVPGRTPFQAPAGASRPRRHVPPWPILAAFSPGRREYLRASARTCASAGRARLAGPRFPPGAAGWPRDRLGDWERTGFPEVGFGQQPCTALPTQQRLPPRNEFPRSNPAGPNRRSAGAQLDSAQLDHCVQGRADIYFRASMRSIWRFWVPS